MPGSFHLSIFVFRQFWQQSYQNQLSFSGKDSTAFFFVFRHFDKKRRSKDKMNPELISESFSFWDRIVILDIFGRMENFKRLSDL